MSEISKLFNNQVATEEQITCPYCKENKSIDEYSEYSNEDLSNYEYMRVEESTFCQYSGCFTCSECYVKIGMPSIEKLKNNAYLMFRLKAESLPHQNSNAIAEYLFG